MHLSFLCGFMAWNLVSFYYQSPNFIFETPVYYLNWNNTFKPPPKMCIHVTHLLILKSTGKEKTHTEHLPRKFILALKLSTLGQASRKSSDRDEMWFLLRFNIFNSFRLRGEHIPDILFLIIRDKVKIKLHKLICFKEKKIKTICLQRIASKQIY